MTNGYNIDAALEAYWGNPGPAFDLTDEDRADIRRAMHAALVAGCAPLVAKCEKRYTRLRKAALAVAGGRGKLTDLTDAIKDDAQPGYAPEPNA